MQHAKAMQAKTQTVVKTVGASFTHSVTLFPGRLLPGSYS
jgi:hypothetical protein